MREFLKKGTAAVFRYVFILILAMALGVFCLVAAYIIPLSDQSGNVLESFRILEEEGWYPVIPYIQKFTGVFGSYQESPGILDNYTDANGNIDIDAAVNDGVMNEIGTYTDPNTGQSQTVYGSDGVRTLEDAVASGDISQEEADEIEDIFNNW